MTEETKELLEDVMDEELALDFNLKSMVTEKFAEYHH